jgi:hypothetical protein
VRRRSLPAQGVVATESDGCGSRSGDRGWEAEVKSLTVEDRLALLDLIAEYAYRWDSRDADGWSDLFIEDAIWEMHDFGSVRTEEVFHTRSALRAVAASAGSERAATQPRHHQGSTLITDIGQDTAHARTLFLVTTQRADEAVPRIFLSGVYEDDFVRTAAGWRFAKRVAYTGGPGT